MRSDLMNHIINIRLIRQVALTAQYIEKAQCISNIDIPEVIGTLNGQGRFKGKVSAHDGNCFT